MRKRVIVGLCAGLAAAGWLYASPFWTLKAMRDAAEARDAEALAAHVDFPALRADLKSDLSAAMMAEMARARATEDMSARPDALGALGLALGLAMLDPLIEGMVSPAGLQMMFAGNPAAASSATPAPLREVSASGEVTVTRNGLSEFRVSGKGDDPAALVFRRDGLGWRLVGIDLPPQALASAQ